MWLLYIPIGFLEFDSVNILNFMQNMVIEVGNKTHLIMWSMEFIKPVFEGTQYLQLL